MIELIQSTLTDQIAKFQVLKSIGISEIRLQNA